MSELSADAASVAIRVIRFHPSMRSHLAKLPVDPSNLSAFRHRQHWLDSSPVCQHSNSEAGRSNFPTSLLLRTICSCIRPSLCSFMSCKADASIMPRYPPETKLLLPIDPICKRTSSGQIPWPCSSRLHRASQARKVTLCQAEVRRHRARFLGYQPTMKVQTCFQEDFALKSGQLDST